MGQGQGALEGLAIGSILAAAAMAVRCGGSFPTRVQFIETKLAGRS